jgi:hypothetical protein
MGSFGVLIRSVPLFLLLLVLGQGVSAWTVQDLVIKPGAGPIPPQTPVTVSYTVSFDSWMTGSTFPYQNTLDMYTDLENAQWVVTKTDIEEDRPPVASPFLTKSGVRARIDGWSLSYARMKFELNVQLKGVAPAVNQTQDKIIIRIQEWGSDGQPITATIFSRKYQIQVQTPTPLTSPPTQIQTPAETAQTQNTPQTPVTPTKKQTYSPGPEPLLIFGMLAALAIGTAIRRKN